MPACTPHVAKTCVTSTDVPLSYRAHSLIKKLGKGVVVLKRVRLQKASIYSALATEKKNPPPNDVGQDLSCQTVIIPCHGIRRVGILEAGRGGEGQTDQVDSPVLCRGPALGMFFKLQDSRGKANFARPWLTSKLFQLCRRLD
jgi:hypothetical protein